MRFVVRNNVVDELINLVLREVLEVVAPDGSQSVDFDDLRDFDIEHLLQLHLFMWGPALLQLVNLHLLFVVKRAYCFFGTHLGSLVPFFDGQHEGIEQLGQLLSILHVIDEANAVVIVELSCQLFHVLDIFFGPLAFISQKRDETGRARL